MDTDKIIAYLNNDDEEINRQEVEQWIANNREEFQSIKFVWEKSGIDPQEDPDMEKAWSRINPETRHRILARKKWLKIQTTRFQRIAAILILALILGLSGYLHFIKIDKSEVAWLQVKNDSDQVREVALNDGTVVWLNSASDIRYPKSFNKRNRNVYLEGEAYFEVEHDKRKPFVVHAGNSVTTVLGTSFDVKSELSGDVQVNVVTGVVALSGIEDANKRVVLKRGETGLYSEPDQRVEKQLNQDINFLAWKTGKLSFRNTPLEEVCEILTRQYKTKVQIGSAALKPIHLTADYDHKKLEEVLNILKLTLNIQYQYSDTAVVLTPEK